MGCHASLLSSRLTFSHVSAGGIPAGTAETVGHHRTRIMGIPVSVFQRGDKSLGQVVQSVMERRDLHSHQPKHQQSYEREEQRKGQPKHAPQMADQEASRRRTNSPWWATTGPVTDALRDGTVPCQYFNRGECSHAYSCSSGVHKCAKILRHGRVCAMTSHGAYNCRQL